MPKIVLILSLIVLASSGHQYGGYLGGIRPVYIVEDGGSPVVGGSDEVTSPELTYGDVGRSGVAAEESEEQSQEDNENQSAQTQEETENQSEGQEEAEEEADEEEEEEPFTEHDFTKRRRSDNQQVRGDTEEFEVPDSNKRGQARLIWPFSLSVEKGHHGHGHHGHHFGPPKHLGHHHHHQHYQGYGGGHQVSSNPFFDQLKPEDVPYATDEEVLHSKAYKKYRKKKKKKIKKLKKKLKFKRVLQKILSKSINKWDYYAPYR